jgi:hypothetical protein
VVDAGSGLGSKMTFQVLKPDDPQWDTAFDLLALEQQDVFYSSGFARLCQDTLNVSDDVRCAIMIGDQGGVLMYPFVQRDVGALLNAEYADGLNDTVGLYGRGGLIGEAHDDDVKKFCALLERHFENQNVFCSFDRFHPVIGNHTKALHTAKVMEIGGFVVVDLRPSIDDVEKNFKPSVRKDIRKAQRNEVQCFCEGGDDHLEVFLDIYYQTMDRNSAAEFHYFSEKFFASLKSHIPDQFLFFYAVHQGVIVSCELVLYHGKYSHSFLGGTQKESLPLAVNPILKQTILQKMKSLGCDYFLLGGGYEPNDGIFNFKKAYAPEGVYPSYIGGSVWQPDVYQKLKVDMSASDREISATKFQYYDV